MSCFLAHLVVAGRVSTIAGVPRKTGFKDGIGSQALFDLPVGLAVTPQGNLLCADCRNNRVRQINLQDGKFTVTTLIGSGKKGKEDGPALECSLDKPRRVVCDAAGNVFLGQGRCYNAKTGGFTDKVR